MVSTKQSWFLDAGESSLLKTILPVISGFIMLVASVLPWLTDPLLGNSSAWKLTVDIGWQVRTGFLSYGLLCFLCALYVFLVAAATVRHFKGSHFFVDKYILAAVLCLIPPILFLLQYLFIDMPAMSILTQHKIQMLLIMKYFGYAIKADRLTIDPFTFVDSTVLGRLQLLFDQVSIGLVLPLLAAGLLLSCRNFVPKLSQKSTRNNKWKYTWIVGLGVLLLGLGRGPFATTCVFEAKQSLSSGNYVQALNWLGWAQKLNPSLLQVSSFHIERGEALYFLHPDQNSDDSRAYLASVYRSNKNFLKSYQELLAVWQAHPATPWVVHEMSTTIEDLAGLTNLVNGSVIFRNAHDNSALVWAQLLIKIDPTNLFGQYLDGFIMYDLHDYSACTTQMQLLLTAKPNDDIRSSALTYLGLSDIQIGKYSEGRNLLFEALKFDPSYRNNTAREALSGLY